MARSPLLLIDDSRDNLKLLEAMLDWAGFTEMRSCTRAKDALELLGSYDPHAIILDLRMPEMDGYEFLRQFKQQRPPSSFLPILVYTADLSSEAKIKALELGASDFLTKPGDAIEIQLRVRHFLQIRHLQAELQDHNQRLEEKVRQRTEHLDAARQETVEILASACEYRDDETGNHARRVGEVCGQIALALGLEPEFAASLEMVAPLHDIGKIAIPDGILRKPGPLTDEERAAMKEHVTVGGRLFDEKASPLLQLAQEIALYHHEQWDGSGYAAGLKGEEIPLCARIVAVADAFDAMTNDRPYRRALSVSAALQELEAKAGTQFDPNVVLAFVRAVQEAREPAKAAA